MARRQQPAPSPPPPHLRPRHPKPGAAGRPAPPPCPRPRCSPACRARHGSPPAVPEPGSIARSQWPHTPARSHRALRSPRDAAAGGAVTVACEDGKRPRHDQQSFRAGPRRAPLRGWDRASRRSRQEWAARWSSSCYASCRGSQERGGAPRRATSSASRASQGGLCLRSIAGFWSTSAEAWVRWRTPRWTSRRRASWPRTRRVACRRTRATCCSRTMTTT